MGFDDHILKNLASVAVILAALIAAAMAFLNLLLTKELKAAELRDAWAGSFRDEIATFCGSARLFARSQEVDSIHRVLQREYAAQGKKFDAVSLGLSSPYTPEQIADVRYQTALAMFRVQLLLDSGDSLHGQVLTSMREAVEAQNSFIDTVELTTGVVDIETKRVMGKIEDVAGHAQTLLQKGRKSATWGTRTLQVAMLALLVSFGWGVLAIHKLLNSVPVIKVETPAPVNATPALRMSIGVEKAPAAPGEK
jgi:hypothetical protein